MAPKTAFSRLFGTLGIQSFRNGQPPPFQKPKDVKTMGNEDTKLVCFLRRHSIGTFSVDDDINRIAELVAADEGDEFFKIVESRDGKNISLQKLVPQISTPKKPTTETVAIVIDGTTVEKTRLTPEEKARRIARKEHDDAERKEANKKRAAKVVKKKAKKKAAKKGE